MRLFDDFERTFDGPSDPGESLYAVLNRCADPRAAHARELCNQWYPDYANDAPDDELRRFLGDFRTKDDKQHYAAWFELLMHQTLARLGFDVTPDPKLALPDRELKPDFQASSHGSRVFVEATVVTPENDPFALSNYERDARDKFAQLEISNFTVITGNVSGTLTRHLKKTGIEQKFRDLIAKHDPDIVQRRMDESGYGELPSDIFRFDTWQPTVELLQLPADERAPRKGRVTDWLQAKLRASSLHLTPGHVVAQNSSQLNDLGPI